MVQVSFALLYSVPVIYQQLDYQVIRFNHCSSTNNLTILDLFRLYAPGVYWIDVQFVNYLNLKANHALVLHILRKHNSSDHPDDAVASLRDNREGTDLVQVKDVTEAIKANSGLKLFQLFLGVD